MSTTGRADSISPSQTLRPFSPIRTISTTPIQLIDHTKPASDEDDLHQVESEYDTQGNKGSDSPLSPKATRVSVHLREEINRRKWARYQQDRAEPSSHKRKRSQRAATSEHEQSPASPGRESALRPSSDNGEEGEEEEEEDRDDGDEGSDTWGESALSRSRRHAQERAHDLLHHHHHHDGPEHTHTTPSRPPHTDKRDKDGAIDILYENQRGTFLFGLPFFSSRSLLQFDPPAWVDAHFKPSATDIRNAEVPDPSWTWAWRTWYVDMSRDVDEEGWEYSFWFRRRTAWHGNHPWYGSFVRRRRWLRERVRRQSHAAMTERAHAMAPDYFTIHNTYGVLMSPGGYSMGVASVGNRCSVPPTSATWGAKDWHTQLREEFTEIRDIPTLMKAMRKATIDREKIAYVTQFLDQCGDELYYLADQMGEIMALFVFQNSRRQLLAILMHRFDEASKHREEHEERGQKEDEEERKYIDNLLRAIDTADDECQKLEYWSDARDVARKGETLHATGHSREWGHGWQGVDASGPGINLEESPAEKRGESGDNQRVDKGKGKATSNRDGSVPPEQISRRRSMPGVWPSNEEHEGLELEKDDSEFKEKVINGEEFKAPPEKPAISLLKIGNLSLDDEEDGVGREDKLKKRDVSGNGNVIDEPKSRDISDTGKSEVRGDEEGIEEPDLHQILRRRAIPGVGIDGARETSGESDEGKAAKSDHQKEHAAIDSEQTQTGTVLQKPKNTTDNYSKPESDEIELQVPPARERKSAEAQVSENLKSLQAEGEKGENDTHEERAKGDEEHKPSV